MMKKVIKILMWCITIAFFVFAFLALVPRTYDVPAIEMHPNMAYWKLSDGSQLAYNFLQAQSPQKAFPIIYLHGGPGGMITSNIIDSHRPLADAGYDVYLYDQIGSGHSDRLENILDYTVDRHVRDLKEVTDQIGAERYIFIAQSWGALLLTQFMIENASRVEKIILTGPGPVLPVRTALASIPAPDSLRLKDPPFSNRQANQKVSSIRSRMMKTWAYIRGKKLATDQEADDFFTSLVKELNKSTFCDPEKEKTLKGGSGYYAHIMTLKSFSEVEDQRDKIRNEQTLLLLMKGQCDNQKWGFTQEYLELFPRHQLAIIPDAGHAISSEKPVLYTNTIKKFLTE